MRFLSVGVLVIHFYIFHACEKYSFVKEQDVEFKDHVITTMTTPYVEMCWDKCVWIMNCFSINVRMNNFGMVECELNNSSKKASPGSLVPTQGSQYHQMKEINDCDNVECKIKEKLPDEWYRLGNSVIKMFHENKTWMDAQTHCQTMGGDLLSIGTAYENNFVKDVLIKKEKGDDLPGIVRYWPLDGSDDDVKLVGTPATPRYEALDGENALYFPGFRTYAEVPAVVFNPEGFTFMLWVKPANQSAHALCIYSDWYSPHTFILALYRNYKSIFFWLRGEDGNQVSTYYLNIAMDGWNHIAVTWNKTESLVKVALNGTVKQTTTSTLKADIRRTAHNIYHLGIKSDELPTIKNDYTFHGHMKHLMVFNKTLNVEEIQKAMYYREDGPWIGLSVQNNTNTFKWSDGTNTQFMDQMEQLPSYQPNPSLSGRKCALFGRNGKWFDKFCSEKRSYICKKPFV
ncbi:uncharacterized protein LOC116302779 [Actinia tenebrosa]|uniref:Uncharacterized protein LOC116302779 n=1 Tax=Actinia tenebrosa TaxID=6105 RepID=A0A6P8INR4_ACTTE|nr:uncharacterized protein LOC116302779 [Actinia tenebrosa]